MKHKIPQLDIIGLFLAGLVNTFLASLDAGFNFAPGTPASQSDILLRMNWIAEHTLRWQGGWLFWFAVTLTFSWSYYALGRHLDARPSRNLAIGLALIAAAVDIVGVLINLIVLPTLASDPAQTQIFFLSMENLANALANVAAFGLYSIAGLFLLPAIFFTHDYPQRLRWLSVAEWGIALIATIFLVVLPHLATVPLLISFALYAPWVWGSAFWLYKRERQF